MRVKICGITRFEDAERAVEFGADALGLNFWSGSKRRCDLMAAKQIVSSLPPFVTAVGVFVNPTLVEVREVIAATGIGVVQLHGDESPAFCAEVPRPVIKAIRISAAGPSADPATFAVAAILVDADSRGFGGSGKTFDWARLPERTRPLILAGGLTPENVAEAVRVVRPYAVDVASGVERSPGFKDAERMKRFIEAAKEAAA